MTEPQDFTDKQVEAALDASRWYWRDKPEHVRQAHRDTMRRALAAASVSPWSGSHDHSSHPTHTQETAQVASDPAIRSLGRADSQGTLRTDGLHAQQEDQSAGPLVLAPAELQPDAPVLTSAQQAQGWVVKDQGGMLVKTAAIRETAERPPDLLTPAERSLVDIIASEQGRFPYVRTTDAQRLLAIVDRLAPDPRRGR